MQKKVVVVHADIVKVCMKELLGVEQMTDKEYEELGIDECSYPVIDMASGYTSSSSMESSSSSTTNRSVSITSSRVIKSHRKKACDRLFKPETPEIGILYRIWCGCHQIGLWILSGILHLLTVESFSRLFKV